MAYHDVAFEDAIGIFEGPTFEKADERFDYGEARVYAIGIANGVEKMGRHRRLAPGELH